jgi:hypothetical protein
MVTHASIRKEALVAKVAKKVTKLEHDVLARILVGISPFSGAITPVAEKNVSRALDRLIRKELIKKLAHGLYRWRLTALGNHVLKLLIKSLNVSSAEEKP